MAPGSHYDKAKADRAVNFIECLCHTKGVWAGKPFKLFPWQEQIIRDIFGTVKANGFRQFTTAYVEIPKKNGKQLALDTLIPAPDGFTTMGAIRVGDTVFDDRGQPCHVVAKSPVDFEEQAYRITFRDGEVIEAGERHLWTGELTAGKHRPATINTGELYRMPRDGTSIRFRIPVAGALETDWVELPVDPYLYGYWLGNGNAVKPEITIRTCDVPEVIGWATRCHAYTSAWQNTGDSMVFRFPDLRKVLVGSFHDKVIPLEYLRAGYWQRRALLQGLMDSDGHVSTSKGQAIYVSAERPLAESVSQLLWTLGIKNAINTAVSTQRADWSKSSADCGRIETGETLYYVKFTAFRDLPVAGLIRKVERHIERNPASRSNYRYIDKIEPITNPGMQCIQVDSPSHLYLVGKSCIPTHNSELAAAIALYLTCADGEERAEVYGCAADRQQASIVYEVAADMVRMTPALSRRVKINASTKRMLYGSTNSIYQVLSAEAYSKHGFNVSGVVFDELHTQPDRRLFDVMTKGSGDARAQPLYFLITTAGTDLHSVCYEQHQKAQDIIDGKKHDPTYYPCIYGADLDDDWTDPQVWRKANPSLGLTIPIEKVQDACNSAQQNPFEENSFRQLRLNQWVKQEKRWMPMDKWRECAFPVNPDDLEGRACYGGLDLSSTGDITAFVLVFPPEDEEGKYQILPFFWIPEDNMDRRVLKDHVPYDLWYKQGLLNATEGNVIHYAYIEQAIQDLGERYNIREIVYDRWGATQLSQDLEGMGFTVVPFGQGFKDMSPACKSLYDLVMQHMIAHGGHPVLDWMADNVAIRMDPAGNIKMDKAKSTEKIDGMVALAMGLARAMVGGNADQGPSVYDERGLLFI